VFQKKALEQEKALHLGIIQTMEKTVTAGIAKLKARVDEIDAELADFQV
jgi:hypothetical protein